MSWTEEPASERADAFFSSILGCQLVPALWKVSSGSRILLCTEQFGRRSSPARTIRWSARLFPSTQFCEAGLLAVSVTWGEGTEEAELDLLHQHCWRHSNKRTQAREFRKWRDDSCAPVQRAHRCR
jgi:hypothetical protein